MRVLPKGVVNSCVCIMEEPATAVYVRRGTHRRTITLTVKVSNMAPGNKEAMSFW